MTKASHRLVHTQSIIIIMTALLDRNGPLDFYASIIAVAWTTTWYLAFGWNVNAAVDLLQVLFPWLNLLDAGGTLDLSGGIAAMGGAAYALPCLATYLPHLLGTETPGGQHARYMYGFWVWLGWMIFNVAQTFVFDTSFGGTPACYAWIVNNLAMVYLNLRWAGGSKAVLSKIKMV